MTAIRIKVQVRTIEKAQNAVKSKESALKFLKDAGIFPATDSTKTPEKKNEDPVTHHHPFSRFGFHSCDREVGLRVLSGKIDLQPIPNHWNWLALGLDSGNKIGCGT